MGGVPSKLLQHEKRELPSKPGKEDNNKSPLSASENTPDQSIPKAGNRERPSNQEKSTDKPHSDIQMPKKGVPSKLLPYEKKEVPKTAKHSTPSSDGEETDDISTDTPSFEIPMPTKGVPSKLLQHEKREMPEREFSGKPPSSSTQSTPNQSLPKTGNREKPSNQEKSSDQPRTGNREEP